MTITMKEIKDAVEEMGKAQEQYHARFESRIDDLEKRSGRPLLGGDSTKTSRIRTAEQEEHKTAFGTYLRKGDDSALRDIEKKAMNSGTDPEGGYLVIPEMDDDIDRIAPTISAFYGLAAVKRIKSNKWAKRVKTSGMAARRVAEGGTGGETTEPRYAKIEVEVFPMECEPWVYNDTLEDADGDLEMDLGEEAGIAFGELMGSEFVSGTGLGESRGILGYTEVANSSYSWGNVGYIVSGKSAAFASVAPADNLLDLVHSLKPQYRRGATWVMNDATLGEVRKLKDQSGSYYLFQPDPSGEFAGRLFGYPVAVDDNMPDIGAGSLSIAFGNWKRAYQIIVRRGTRLIRDPYTSKGTTKFNFTRRMGGGVKNFEAYKLMKFATN